MFPNASLSWHIFLTGRTIIEALEQEIGPDAAEVKFGIVLLTLNDLGYSKTEGAEKLQPRARQNVVLEMGVLLSSMGRKNVAILKKRAFGCAF